jgi:hypothetical protein
VAEHFHSRTRRWSARPRLMDTRVDAAKCLMSKGQRGLAPRWDRVCLRLINRLGYGGPAPDRGHHGAGHRVSRRVGLGCPGKPGRSPSTRITGPSKTSPQTSLFTTIGAHYRRSCSAIFLGHEFKLGSDLGPILAAISSSLARQDLFDCDRTEEHKLRNSKEERECAQRDTYIERLRPCTRDPRKYKINHKHESLKTTKRPMCLVTVIASCLRPGSSRVSSPILRRGSAPDCVGTALVEAVAIVALAFHGERSLGP